MDREHVPKATVEKSKGTIKAQLAQGNDHNHYELQSEWQIELQRLARTVSTQRGR